jgi:glycerophosphoryl diester phosphodiesterase
VRGLAILFVLSLTLASGCSTAPAGVRVDAAPPTQNQIVAGALADVLDCLRANNRTLVYGHRGGPARGFPENALETLRYSASLGVQAMEVDVRTTADGALVLMHDDVLDRTTNVSGPIAQKTLADLRAVQLKDATGALTPFGIPTLSGVLDWATDQALLVLDPKDGVDLGRLVQTVDQAKAQQRVIIIADDSSQAALLQRLDPALTVSVSVTTGADVETLHNERINWPQVVAWFGTTTPATDVIAALQKRSVELGGYTDTPSPEISLASTAAPVDVMRRLGPRADVQTCLKGSTR